MEESPDDLRAIQIGWNDITNDGQSRGIYVPNPIDQELERKRTQFPTLDIRSNASGELIRHIEPWSPVILGMGEHDVTVTPCRCVKVDKADG